MSISYYEAGMNASPFSRFRILLRLRRLREPPIMPPGRPSPSEVGAGTEGENEKFGLEICLATKTVPRSAQNPRISTPMITPFRI